MKLKTFIIANLLLFSLSTNQLFEVLEKGNENKQQNSKNLFDSLNFIQKNNNEPEKETNSVFEEIKDETNRMPPVKVEKVMPENNKEENNRNKDCKGEDCGKVKECKGEDCDKKKNKKKECKGEECEGKKKKDCKSGDCNGKSKENKEVEILKETVIALIETNNKIMNKIKKLEKGRQPREIVSFLEKNQDEVDKLNNKLKKTTDKVQTEIDQKGQQLETIINITSEKYTELKNKLDSLDKKVTQQSRIHNSSLQKLEQELITQEINSNTLNAKIANIQNIESRHIELDGISINGNSITINNPEFIINFLGQEISIGEILETLNSFKILQEICGSDFEKCQPIPEDKFNGDVNKKEKILNSLKKLRKETNTIIDQTKRKKFR